MAAIRTRARGYSLVIVMMTLGLITVSILSLWAYLEASSKVMGESLGQRRTFYVCDGMTRMVSLLLGSYARETDAPTTAAAMVFITDPARGGVNLANITPAGYAVDDFQIDDVTLTGDAVRIPNGPFSGLVGRESQMRFRIKVISAAGSEVCKIEKALALSEVGLFQFTIFGALDDTSITYAPATASSLIIDGRVHANGNLCFATNSNATIWAESASAGGSIRNYESLALCKHTKFFPDANVKLRLAGRPPFPPAGLPAALDVSSLDATSDSRVASWTTNVWGPNARDQAHGVHALTVPGSSYRTGVRSAANNNRNQKGELRYLVDPPWPNEPVEEQRTHLSYQADLRIIDGVWYLKDPANPSAWPGTPIWSDHPGSARDRVVDSTFATFVDPDPAPPDESFSGTIRGHARMPPATARALALDVNVAQSQFTAGNPRRFSWYEVDPVSNALRDAVDMAAGTTPERGVISYGSLGRIPGAIDDNAMWTPAVSAMCTGTCSIPTELDHCALPATPVVTTDNRSFPIGSPALCGSLSSHFRMAAATRIYVPSPFLSGNDTAGPGGCPCSAGSPCGEGVGSPQAHSHRRYYHPVNFDIAAFQEALNDTDAGELGSYFSAARPFNGIVWISSLSSWNWGMAATQDEPDPWAPSTAEHSEAHGMPYPLCSESLGGFVLDAVAPRAVIPGCGSPSYDLSDAPSAVSGDVRANFPNAVRVFNGAHVNRRRAGYLPSFTAGGQLPKGLTIATNLPMLVMGDMNASSTPANVTEGYPGDGTPWVPLLLAANTTVLLSNAWDDGKMYYATGGQMNYDTAGILIAKRTRYHMALLTGYPQYDPADAAAPGDLRSALWTFERWSGETLAIHGAVAFGYQAVYMGRAEHTTFLGQVLPTGADPTRLEFRFDHRLAHLKNQPPGAVAFSIESVRNWQRR